MDEKKPIAHVVSDKIRTLDVELDETLTFEHFSLDPLICAALKKTGFEHPSPIQARAIPQTRCGRDTFIRAKSGTGKTLVFVITVLQRFITKPEKSLILVPTREIAVQICEIMNEIGADVPGFKAQIVIGGTSFSKDREGTLNTTCYVGTPGRVLSLMKRKVLNTSKIRLLVFDEADRLMESLDRDTVSILEFCKNRKQLVVVSATFPKSIENTFKRYMRNPIPATPKEEAPILLGLSQFSYRLPETTNVKDEMDVKLDHLVMLLNTLSYNQCLIFVNSQLRAESYQNNLRLKGIETDCITGAHDQSVRLETFERIKESADCRIIISTDLFSRGIDVDRINLVINLELPMSQETYLHRIGRGGRFGSLSMAVTFIVSDDEEHKFTKMLDDNFFISKLTAENAKQASECTETGKALNGFSLLFTPKPIPIIPAPKSDYSDEESDTNTSPRSVKIVNVEEKVPLYEKFREKMKLKAAAAGTEDTIVKKIQELKLDTGKPVIPSNKGVKPKDASHYINKPVGSEGGIESDSDTDDSFSESSGESNESVFDSSEQEEQNDFLEYDVDEDEVGGELNAHYRHVHQKWTDMFYHQVANIHQHAKYATVINIARKYPK